MNSAKVPRVVVVTRPTDFQALVARHGTREQARFFLETRSQRIEEVERRHLMQEEAMIRVSQAIPVRWRRVRVERADLSRFVFEPEDVVVAVGQDGLIANVAKYLSGQRVIGVNPDPARYDGVLVHHRPDEVARVLLACHRDRVEVQERTLVEARQDDGQSLRALNEIFVGHRSHQSARYRVRWEGREERQSSSGLIVTTGTGATGWARSIALQRSDAPPLPAPGDRRLAFFVREPFPSVSTGVSLTQAVIPGGRSLEITSEMNEGGVLFGDGIEDDRVEFPWGARVEVRVAEERLSLVA